METTSALGHYYGLSCFLKGSSIGYKRLLRFPPVTARRIKLHILEAQACPLIAKIGLYLSPS